MRRIKTLVCAMYLGIGLTSVGLADLRDSLIAYYPFDDSAGTTLHRQLGVADEGTLFNFPDDNSAWVSGQIGGALLFDGVDDYVIVPHGPSLTDAVTVSIWAYANAAPPWASLVKNWGGGMVGQYHFGLGPGDSDTLNVFITQGDGQTLNVGTDSTSIELDVWEHYAFVADPSQRVVTLYRNGEVVDERPYDGAFYDSPNSEAMGIGVKTNDDGSTADLGNPGYWDGMLDELGMWNRALSATEISALYAQGSNGRPLTASPTLEGDFDGSGDLDFVDINLMHAQIRAQTNPSSFDLNHDGLVNVADRDRWLTDLKRTYVGDSNFDGVFDSSDLVDVFIAGEFEDTIAGTSRWETGDWNGDAEFDTADFVEAFQAGGYELPPRAAVAAVPEPTAMVLGIGSMLSLLVSSRRRR